MLVYWAEVEFQPLNHISWWLAPFSSEGIEVLIGEEPPVTLGR